MITTTSLQLVPVERTHIEALLRHKRDLAALLGVRVPDSWPHFPEAFSLPADTAHEPEPPPADWPGYFFIHTNDRVLVGNGGFKGEPDGAGMIEIGYEIASEHWNRGFATAAAQALIAYAFAHPHVQSVAAHTLAETNASNSVLQKVGMRFAGEVAHPEVGKIWRWQIRREDHRPAQPAPAADES